jgi:hypothetical protein
MLVVEPGVPASVLLAADDVFGEVFMAGMSIAFAAIGATVLVGVLVRGRYDDVEQSFFDAQDAALEEEEAKRAVGRDQAARDFFSEDASPPPSAASDFFAVPTNAPDE